MTHQEIEQKEIIELYVSDRLGHEERTAFEEHFFACDECFEKVQMTERFVAGVRYGAQAGLLEGVESVAPRWPAWLKPAFAAAAAACLLLAVALVWLVIYRIPQLDEKTAQERQQRERVEEESREKIERLNEQLQSEQQQRADLEKELASARAGNQNPAPSGMEANPPMITLESSREAATNEITLSAVARSLIIWLDVGPDDRFALYRLEIHDKDNHLIQTINGLRKNSDGGLTLILPARIFQTGKYRLKLYGSNGQSLVAEYLLQVRKR
jgi:hypothetical protein